MKIVIVGAGEVGYHIAGRLALENQDVVVIDKSETALQRISDNLDVQVIQGSGGSPVILRRAGIQEAEILLAVTDSDETNLVACLVADALSPNTKKLARLRDVDYDDFHETFQTGAPRIKTIINPEVEVVRTIDRLMSVPGAVDVSDFADGRVKLIGVRMSEKTPLCGVHLHKLPDTIGRGKLLVAAVIRNEKLIIPRGDDQLLANDLVYLFSETDKLEETLALFQIRSEPIRNALIVGGGRVGTRLAILMESRSIHAKIIEKDEARAHELAKKLNNVMVLHGDGSDQQLLSEENIAGMDVVITLTNDEETNILTSLMARRMGARQVITKVNKFSYFPVMLAIGLEQVVNTRLSAINTIIQFIRQGKVLSAVSLKDEQAEVLEAIAMETSDIVDKPIHKVGFPKGSLVTAIFRNDKVIIPTGDSVIKVGDRVIIFAHRLAIPKIEKRLAVKLEYF